MLDHTNAAGFALIDPSTVEVELFAGGVRVASYAEARAMGERVDFGHVVMTGLDGTVFARSILKGEREDDVAAMLRARGCVDAECCPAFDDGCAL